MKIKTTISLLAFILSFAIKSIFASDLIDNKPILNFTNVSQIINEAETHPSGFTENEISRIKIACRSEYFYKHSHKATFVYDKDHAYPHSACDVVGFA